MFSVVPNNNSVARLLLSSSRDRPGSGFTAIRMLMRLGWVTGQLLSSAKYKYILESYAAVNQINNNSFSCGTSPEVRKKGISSLVCLLFSQYSWLCTLSFPALYVIHSSITLSSLAVPPPPSSLQLMCFFVERVMSLCLEHSYFHRHIHIVTYARRRRCPFWQSATHS